MVLGQGMILFFAHSTYKCIAALIYGNLNLQGLPFPQVTTSGQFVFPLDSPHKKPYESLVLGRYRCSAEDSR